MRKNVVLSNMVSLYRTGYGCCKGGGEEAGVHTFDR